MYMYRYIYRHELYECVHNLVSMYNLRQLGGGVSNYLYLSSNSIENQQNNFWSSIIIVISVYYCKRRGTEIV